MNDVPSPARLPPMGRVERLDLDLGRRLARKRKKPAVQAAAKAGKLGDQEPLYAMSLGLALVGVVRGDRRLLGAAISVGAAVLAADLAKSLIKRRITRSRPHVLLDEGRYERAFGGSEEKPLQSFPSGHMAGSIAAAAALMRVYPRTAPVTLAACLGLGWSRMSKAAHWPLDVAAGAVAGLVVEALTSPLLGRAWAALPWARRGSKGPLGLLRRGSSRSRW